MTDPELLALLDKLRAVMISVATGGARIGEVNNEFQEDYRTVADELRNREIENPLPYSDLWQWYGKWSADIAGYGPRRAYVADLFAPLISRVRASRVAETPPTGWARVDRTVCGKQVFYYQCPHGGRVFFDNLGWPWPKHGCTDNPRSRKGRVEARVINSHTAFRSAQGEPLDLYELLSIAEKRNIVHMRFRRMNENRSFSVSLALGRLRDHDITIDDLWTAPSFVVRSYETHRIVEFISGRKKRIDTLTLARSGKGSA
ncbi:hypothetical protein NKH33_15275 [Mesorhizobium sp. M1182]|uniref:hypothetical protein n=1 Tax=unclassified Mesorhizobium TaxID=325217 RepID=UPI0033362614